MIVSSDILILVENIMMTVKLLVVLLLAQMLMIENEMMTAALLLLIKYVTWPSGQYWWPLGRYLTVISNDISRSNIDIDDWLFSIGIQSDWQ